MTTGTKKYLRGVWGTGPTDVLAAGDNGTVLRFDGKGWKATLTWTTQYLMSLWGSSASDILAVGAAGTVLRFNGAKWKAEASGSGSVLRAVWGSSTSNVLPWAAVAPSCATTAQAGRPWPRDPNNCFSA